MKPLEELQLIRDLLEKRFGQNGYILGCLAIDVGIGNKVSFEENVKTVKLWLEE